LSRPDPTRVGVALATVPAGIVATSAPSLPLTIDNTNHTIKIGVNGGSVVTATIANAAYSTLATLLAAINTALTTAGIDAVAVAAYNAPTKILFHTVLAVGPGASITLDTNGNGSTGDAALGFSTSGATGTVSTASTVITNLLPVGGPLDVSSATVRTQDTSGLIGATDAMVTAIADAIAPKFAETSAATNSFHVGNMHGYLSASYSPDPNRVPALATGAAITVVQDDGVTLFT
jgi:hypothetical protein